jgi:shikimate kinase
VPEAPTRIVLVGFMGAGKTSVGTALAELLGWSFADLDRSIESRAGLSIAEIFERSGEPAFRALERDAARDALRAERVVVATGGGAFAEPETRALLSAAATVYLECDLETLLARVPLDGSRPLAGNRETMRRLLLAREPAYRSAVVTLQASRGTPAELALQIARALKVPLPG